MGSDRSKFYMGVILTAVFISLLVGKSRTVRAATPGTAGATLTPSTTGIGIIGTWKTGSTTLKIQVGGDIYESIFRSDGFDVYSGKYHVVDRNHISIIPFTDDAPIQGVFEVQFDGDQMLLVNQAGSTITLSYSMQAPPGGMSFFN